MEIGEFGLTPVRFQYYETENIRKKTAQSTTLDPDANPNPNPDPNPTHRTLYGKKIRHVFRRLKKCKSGGPH